MTTNPPSENTSPENTPAASGVTREMLHVRTRELAVQAGRSPSEITQGDYERARRELTGERDVDKQEAVLNRPENAVPPPPDAGDGADKAR